MTRHPVKTALTELSVGVLNENFREQLLDARKKLLGRDLNIHDEIERVRQLLDRAEDIVSTDDFGEFYDNLVKAAAELVLLGEQHSDPDFAIRSRRLQGEDKVEFDRKNAERRAKVQSLPPVGMN